MSSVQPEVLLEALQPLDRWTLDAVQISDRRCRRLTAERMSGLCLRQVQHASFRAPEGDYDGTWEIRITGRPGRRGVANAHQDYTAAFAAFITLLRSAWVDEMTCWGVTFTSALASLVLEAPIIANRLTFASGSYVDLTPAQLNELVLHFSPVSVDFDDPLPISLRADQVSDDFLRVLSKNHVREIRLPKARPVDGDFFSVTDDGVVDFCVHQDPPGGEDEDDAPMRKLIVYKGTFTKDLFKRLVGANTVSTHTHPVHIFAAPSLMDDEDLHDFAQHLSYRYRGREYEWRIYDFFGERRGAPAAMDLQIVLLPHDLLDLTRARRPNRPFQESGE